MRTKDLTRYSYCLSAWIFGNTCEIRILYVLLLFFGMDIGKPARTKDLIRIGIVFRLGYLETRANYASYTYCYCFSAWIFGNPYELGILYVFVIVLRLRYLETRAN